MILEGEVTEGFIEKNVIFGEVLYRIKGHDHSPSKNKQIKSGSSCSFYDTCSADVP